MALFKCPQCGNQVSDKASKCPKCGTDLTNLYVCPECGAHFSCDLESCPECGCPNEKYVKPATLYKCPDCGNEYDVELTYCPECGCPNECVEKNQCLITLITLVQIISMKRFKENRACRDDVLQSENLNKEGKITAEKNYTATKISTNSSNKSNSSSPIGIFIIIAIILILFGSCSGSSGKYKCGFCGKEMSTPYAARLGKYCCYSCYKKYWD